MRAIQFGASAQPAACLKGKLGDQPFERLKAPRAVAGMTNGAPKCFSTLQRPTRSRASFEKCGHGRLRVDDPDSIELTAYADPQVAAIPDESPTLEGSAQILCRSRRLPACKATWIRAFAGMTVGEARALFDTRTRHPEAVLHLKCAATDGRGWTTPKALTSPLAPHRRSRRSRTDRRNKMPRGPGGALGAVKTGLGRDRPSRGCTQGGE